MTACRRRPARSAVLDRAAAGRQFAAAAGHRLPGGAMSCAFPGSLPVCAAGWQFAPATGDPGPAPARPPVLAAGHARPGLGHGSADDQPPADPPGQARRDHLRPGHHRLAAAWLTGLASGPLAVAGIALTAVGAARCARSVWRSERRLSQLVASERRRVEAIAAEQARQADRQPSRSCQRLPGLAAAQEHLRSAAVLVRRRAAAGDRPARRGRRNVRRMVSPAHDHRRDAAEHPGRAHGRRSHRRRRGRRASPAGGPLRPATAGLGAPGRPAQIRPRHRLRPARPWPTCSP